LKLRNGRTNDAKDLEGAAVACAQIGFAGTAHAFTTAMKLDSNLVVLADEGRHNAVVGRTA
jgi:hypothetical protein